MASESAILNWMLALPVAGGLVILLLPESQSGRGREGARAMALVVCLATLALAVMAGRWMNWGVAGGAGGMGTGAQEQLVSRIRMVEGAGISYAVGVDGLSLPLVLLVAGMGVAGSWGSYGLKHSKKAYFALFLFWLAAALGIFVALDWVLLFAFFMVAVICLYFLIAGWGSERAAMTARHFLWYWLAGGAAVMAALIAGQKGGDRWEVSPGWFGVMLGGFAVSMAVVPVHRWLAEVLTEAATPVAMMVVAVMQTAGGYALIRISTRILVGTKAGEPLWWVALLGVITMIYGGLAAAGQKDLRRVVAYGSVAQMGCVLLGIATFTPTGLLGASYLLVGHGVAAAMMVFLAGMIQDRAGHCEIERLGGLSGHMSAFGGWGLLGFLAMMGLPGLCVFVGELLVVMGTFSAGRAGYSEHITGGWVWLGTLSAGMMAMLTGIWVWTYQRVFMGPPRPEHSNWARMSMSEKWILALLGVTAAALGVMPMVVTEPMRGAVEALVNAVHVR